MADPFVPFVPTWLEQPQTAIVPPELAALVPVVPPTDGPVDEMAAPVPGIGIPAYALDAASAQFPPIDAISGGQAPLGMEPTDAVPVDPYASEPPLPPLMAPPVAFDQTTILNPFAQDEASQGAPQSPYAELDGINPLTNPDISSDDAAAAMLDLQRSNPYLATKYATDFQQTRDEDIAMEAMLAAQADARRVRQSQELQRKAVEEANARAAVIEADAVALSQRKIDPNRAWSSKSVGQKAAGLLGAIIGGMSSSGGKWMAGRNDYLAELNNEIDRDIDAQKADIANGWQGINARRGIVADIYARTNDLYQAAETARLALKLSTRDQLMAEAQLYDPRGTRALKLAQNITALDANIAAQRQAAVEKDLEWRMKLAEERRKEIEAADKHAAAQAKLAKTGAGGTTKPRPVLLPSTAWYAQNKITTSGPQAREAYEQYKANVLREQAKWDVSSKSKAPAQAVPSIAAAPGQAVIQGALPSTPGSASTAKAPTAKSGATASAMPRAETSAQLKGDEPEKYASPDEWFEKNAPTASDEEKKSYFFVDGENGAKAPPIKFEDPVAGKEFRERSRIRRQMSEKIDQTVTLVGKLRKSGLWDKIVRSGPAWVNINDPDVQELKSIHQSLSLDGIKANGMGVPTGKDVEMSANMYGADPSKWQDITPQLQRARETLQLETDRDWETYASKELKDPRYNEFRILPLASKGWKEKVANRGAIKQQPAELPNTDPKSLKVSRQAGEAPDVTQAAAIKTFERNSEEARDWLEASGVVAAAEDDLDTAALGAGTSSRARETPQEKDFSYAGPPEGADAFAKLRTHYVNSVANLNEYIRDRNPKLWKAYQDNRQIIAESLGKVLTANKRFYELVPPSKRMTWMQDPELVAHLASVTLRNGGK